MRCVSEGNLYNCTYVESGFKIPKIDWNTATSEKRLIFPRISHSVLGLKDETYGIPFKPK